MLDSTAKKKKKKGGKEKKKGVTIPTPDAPSRAVDFD
jgi:hypothetical protein